MAVSAWHEHRDTGIEGRGEGRRADGVTPLESLSSLSIFFCMMVCIWRSRNGESRAQPTHAQRRVLAVLPQRVLPTMVLQWYRLTL